MLQAKVIANTINNLPVMAFKIMCVLAPVRRQYTLRSESDSVTRPLQVT
jgi:hypothetical protein